MPELSPIFLIHLFFFSNPLPNTHSPPSSLPPGWRLTSSSVLLLLFSPLSRLALCTFWDFHCSLISPRLPRSFLVINYPRATTMGCLASFACCFFYAVDDQLACDDKIRLGKRRTGCDVVRVGGVSWSRRVNGGLAKVSDTSDRHSCCLCQVSSSRFLTLFWSHLQKENFEGL